MEVTPLCDGIREVGACLCIQPLKYYEMVTLGLSSSLLLRRMFCTWRKKAQQEEGLVFCCKV